MAMPNTVMVTLTAPNGDRQTCLTLDYPQAIADAVLTFATSQRVRPHKIEFTVEPWGYGDTDDRDDDND
jgi:hypothetical protein